MACARWAFLGYLAGLLVAGLVGHVRRVFRERRRYTAL
jgi:hypothetical protein